MNDRTFVDPPITLGSPSTRRRALRLLGSGLVGGFAFTAVRESSEAKRARHKRQRSSVAPAAAGGGRVGP